METQQEEKTELSEEPLQVTILEVGGHHFHVNRDLLSRVSRYFEAMFYGGTRETSASHIILKEVDTEAFQILIEFANTSKVILNRQNVRRILETADFFQFEKLVKLCVKFLERELHVCNCLGMMSYAKEFAHNDLYAAARSVALTHLSDLLCEEEFLQLSKESLLGLLGSDDLFVSKEDVVFDAVMQWVMHDSSREAEFLELSGSVRVAFLSLSFLDLLVKRAKRNAEHDIYARLVGKLDKNPPGSWSIMDEVLTTSRSYDTMYILAGKHDKHEQELHQFHQKMGIWQSCAPLQRKNLTQYAVAVVGNLIFVTGGYFRDEFVWYSVDWVLIYNSWDDSWLEGPAMQKSRNCHCAVGVGLYLYVMGGGTDSGIISNVERLAISKTEWESTSSMVRPVERAAAVSKGTKVYVLCGLDENGDVYSGVQRLDTETDVWDVISYSPCPRYDLSATVLNGAIYVIGGNAYRFDTETDEWTLLEEECLNRKFFMGCTTTNGRIYLLGQWKGNQAISNMVQYDPYMDTCEVINHAIPCPLPIRGCVTIRRFDIWAGSDHSTLD
ncbi:kelch-like protein 23 [Protopterus annectens]|uniref:kelch-like protein 23 n=1 Tax=Protopterus annectens TaxID=7888 RepID=UPI001CF9615D|nr:kelch-like protein 23 [Protopterus annectens]